MFIEIRKTKVGYHNLVRYVIRNKNTIEQLIINGQQELKTAVSTAKKYTIKHFFVSNSSLTASSAG